MKTAIIAALLLSGCATWGQDRWYVAENEKPAISYEWLPTSGPAETNKLCQQFSRGAGWQSAGCAYLNWDSRHCTIYSHISEKDASSYIAYGTESLWTHELKHCGLIDGKVWKHD